MDDAMFLQVGRVSGEAHKRVGDQTMTVHVADWLRLLEMAERPEVTIEQIDFAALFQDEDDRAEMARRQAAPIPAKATALDADVRRSP